jgi:hypothetical protein
MVSIGNEIDFLIPDKKQSALVKTFISWLDMGKRRFLIFYGEPSGGTDLLLQRFKDDYGSDAIYDDSDLKAPFDPNIKIVVVRGGDRACQIISDVEVNMPVWVEDTKQSKEFQHIKKVLVDGLFCHAPDHHHGVYGPNTRIYPHLIYITRQTAPDHIKMLGELIHFPHHIPTVLKTIREALFGFWQEMLPKELVQLCMEYQADA